MYKAFFMDFYGTIVYEDGEVVKRISQMIYEFTNDSDLAGYVSDDFGLISDARLLGYNDLWLDKMVACYEKGSIPCGSL